MRTKNLIAILSAALLLFGCSPKRVAPVAAPAVPVINLTLTQNAYADRFVDMDYGIRLNIRDGRANHNILQKYDASAISLPAVRVNPEITSFVSESMRRYMRTMGFNLDADIATDYMMSVTIKEFSVNFLSGIGWAGTVHLNVEVSDSDRQLVYPNVTVTGRASANSSVSDFAAANRVMNEAYANALEDVDWDRIAFFLTKSSTAALEGNKQVSGDGDTALESTVIRWFIDSSPKGADVSIRVVSSTPEVKNTNSNYVGSTPYETTETFDIKGLTFNNSGNVQIEVSCEKAGYVTQRRRFNLRQAIDQKEISAKFNLVKEENL